MHKPAEAVGPSGTPDIVPNTVHTASSATQWKLIPSPGSVVASRCSTAYSNTTSWRGSVGADIACACVGEIGLHAMPPQWEDSRVHMGGILRDVSACSSHVFMYVYVCLLSSTYFSAIMRGWCHRQGALRIGSLERSTFVDFRRSTSCFLCKQGTGGRCKQVLPSLQEKREVIKQQ